MLRKSKRVIALIATAMLVASNTPKSFALDIQTAYESENPEKSIRDIFTQKNTVDETGNQSGIYEDALKNTELKHSPDENVRLIVELKAAPAKDVKENKVKGNEFKKAHDKVKKDIENKGIKGKYRHDYTMGINGFSLETEYKNIKEIKNMPEVASVSIARTYDYEMTSSKAMVEAQNTWEKLGIQGEGMVVAVVDTGVDYRHQDMTLTEEGKKQASLTEANLKGKLAETEVNDRYYTDKVPIGYDWADMDNDVLPGNSSHGTHCAGIIGANGDENNNGVVGVAPGVQIIAEKVFSDSHGGAYEDDIVAGIQHAVEMGADVINLSLGASAGTVDQTANPEQKAIQNAVEQGTMVVVAGGNDYYSTINSIAYAQAKLPYASNPDIGVVGTPGVEPYALQVASYENDNIRVNKATLSDGKAFGFKKQNTDDIVTRLSNKEYELVDCGKGTAAELANLNLTGKIAVISRDEVYSAYMGFQSDAGKKGAVAVVYRGASIQGNYPVITCGSGPNYIPQVTTGFEDGNKLIERLRSGEKIKISFSNDGLWVPSPKATTMSGFSSWGTPLNLDFKPEITAPGGSIYSTVKDNKYDTYSGTSMATPHVVGGSALVLEALKNKGEEKNMETVLKSKIMLMNTSKILDDPTSTAKTPYSPRKQGSGLMQISKAIQSPALVYDRDTTLEKAGAVALKEIKGNKAKFNLTLQALDGKSVDEYLDYDIYIDVLTDEIVNKQYDNNRDGIIDRVVDASTTKTMRIDGSEVKVNGKRISNETSSTIHVKRGQKEELNFEIDLTNATNLKENQFVEGFVRLVPHDNNEIPALTVPYMGFHGDWNSLRNIDETPYAGKENFLGYTALWNELYDGALGYDPKKDKFYNDRVSYSPRSFDSGVFASFAALRNLKKTEMYIEDKDGNMIKYLTDFSEFTEDGTPWKFRKNIMAVGDYGYKIEDPVIKWTGTDSNGNLMPDGDYQYVVRTTLDTDKAEPQVVKMPVKVDSVAPFVKNFAITPENGKYRVSWEGYDSEGGCGYSGATLYVNGQFISDVPLERYGTSYLVNKAVNDAVLIAYDWAGNSRVVAAYGNPAQKSNYLLQTWQIGNSTSVNYKTPAKITAFANKKINWAITIKDSAGNIVDDATIENQDAIYGLPWYPEQGLADGTYSVTITVSDENGYTATTDPKTFKIVNNK